MRKTTRFLRSFPFPQWVIDTGYPCSRDRWAIYLESRDVDTLGWRYGLHYVISKRDSGSFHESHFFGRRY
jgi:hypothetical protein